jgi:hypothetical protein
LFASWTGDYTGPSPNATLRVNAPKTLQANWNTEYLITLKVSGISNSTVVKLTLNNATYDLTANSNYQLWYQKGTTITPVLNQTIPNGFMIYKFSGWTNTTGGPIEGPLTVNAPATYVASYSTEISLPPIPGFPAEAILLGILLGIGNRSPRTHETETQKVIVRIMKLSQPHFKAPSHSLHSSILVYELVIRHPRTS